MPLQNRVTPFGEIVAIPERGTMTGNRGILHDGARRLRRRWATRAWICCVLQFRGRRDPVMAPGHYTRLFFLDEPTALAAGHRPCAYCRRGAYRQFRSAWVAASANRGPGPAPRATEIDRILHAERLGPGGSKRLHRTERSGLPDGVLFTPDVSGRPTDDQKVVDGGTNVWVRPRVAGDMQSLPVLLRWRGAFWHWSPSGYRPADLARSGPVLTLTPPSTVGTLGAGYRPEPPAGLPA